jgi:hypothetical protein
MMKIEFNNGKFQAIANGKIIAESASKQYLNKKVAKMQASKKVDFVVESVEEENTAIKFPINQRFDFVHRLVSMVGKGKTASALITGEGGLGKSHTVIKALHACGLDNLSGIDLDGADAPAGCFTVVKGYSTAKGLYRTLYENRNGIIVFDDCDSILKDPDAVNLLKGALDSYDTRIITWNSMRPDEELPRSFQFNGGVIFISNRPMNKIDQALRTRSMCVDLTMTLDQKLDRMEVIMEQPDFLPGVTVEFKRDALGLIRKHQTVAKEVSLRTLINVSRIRAEGDSDWEDLAAYSLIA